MRLRLCLSVAAFTLCLASPAFAADAIRLVMLGDNTLHGYNVPVEESLPARIEAALATPEHPIEIIVSHNLDTSKSAAVWLLTKAAKALLADPAGAALVLSAGQWDCGVMGLDQTIANLEKVLGAFRDKKIPTLLIGTKPRAFCPEEYDIAYPAIYPVLAEKYGTLLYMDRSDPPADERPEGVEFITWPVPFEELLPSVEQLVEKARGTVE